MMKKGNMIMVAIAVALALFITGVVVAVILSALGLWPEGWRF